LQNYNEEYFFIWQIYLIYIKQIIILRFSYCIYDNFYYRIVITSIMKNNMLSRSF